MSEPRLIDRYELKAVLGQGGMGLVYQAYDRVVRRDVALKTIKGSPSRVALDLFRKECSVLAAICHPNIIEIFDIGQFVENGETKPYFVMPLLPGASLDTLIHDSTQPLSVERFVEISVQTCRGLHAAHENNIVHRDLKPSNIFVMPDDSVKIIDFGIVHMIDTRTTMTVAAGTPAYMSPEQVQGQPASRASDLFSLGVVMYETLTGRAPFRGTEKEIEEAILHEVPPPVSELNPAVNQTISRVVHKAMAKQTAYRFSTARELADTIQKAFRNEPIEIFDSARIQPRIQRAARAAEQGDYQFAQDIIDELVAEGHLDPALTALRKQIENARRQKSIQQLLDAARTRVDQDEYLLALQKIQQVLQLDPQNVTALGLQRSIQKRQSEQKIDEWFRLARQHLDHCAFLHARSALQNVLQLAANDSRALQMLAEIDRREHEYVRVRKEKEELYQSALQAWQGGEVNSALTKLERLMELDRRAPDTSTPSRGVSIQSFYNQVRSEHDSLNNGYEEARQHLAGRHFSSALAICDQFLAKYPGHALFQALKYDIDEQQRQERSARIAEIDRRVQAEPDLDRRVNLLKEALDLYPGDTHFEQDLRNTRDKRDLVNSIVERARAYEDRAQLNEALGQWEILRSVHTSYPGLEIELQRVRNRRDQQARAEARLRWVEQVERQLGAGEYARASDLLHNALLEFPADAELGELQQRAGQGLQRLAEAQQLMAQLQELFRAHRYLDAPVIIHRLRQLDQGGAGAPTNLSNLLLEQAKAALETDWEAAELLIQEVLAMDPANTLANSLRVLALDKKREVFISACIQRIRSLQAAGDLEQAASQAAEGLAAYPGEPQFLQLSASLKKALEESRRKRDDFVNQSISRVQPLRSANNLQGAIALLQQALATYPGEPRLLQALTGLQKELEEWQHRQEEAVRSSLARAEEFRDAGDLVGALLETEKGLTSCPQDPRLKDLQRLLREALDRSREEFVHNCVEQVGEMERAGNLAGAARHVQQALAIHPGDATLTALSTKINSALQQQRRQQEESILGYLADARRQQQAGHLEAALSQTQQGLTAHPGDSRLLQLAEALRKEMEDLQNRREQFVDQCLSKARTLQQSGNPEAALAQIEEGLSSYPDALPLEQMQAQLRAAVEEWRQEKAQFVRTCLAQTRQLEISGDPDGALSQIEAALSRYADEPQLLQMRDRLQRTVQEARRKRDGLLARIRELQAAGDLDAAFRSAQQATLAYPKDSQLIHVASELDRQIQDRQRQREEAIAWCIGRACKLRDSGDLPGALSQIEEALASYPRDAKLEELKRDLDRRIEDERRKHDETVARYITRAHTLQEAGDFQAALAKLEDGLAIYPNDPRLLPIANRLRKTLQDIQKKREEAIALCVARARELQEEGNLPNALTEVDRGLTAYPGDPRLMQLRGFLTRALEEVQRRRAEFVTACLQQAQGLQQAGNLKGALAQIEHGLALYPDEPGLRELELQLHEALADQRRRREEAVLACLGQARTLQAQGDLNAAVARIRQGLSDFPGEPKLIEAAETLQKLLSGETRRREELITACLAEARKSQGVGDLPGALDHVSRGLAASPDDARLLHLRDALQTALDEERRKREELVSGCLREIRKLQSAGDLKAALAQAGQALSFYPGEPRLVDLHAAIVQAYEEYRRKQEEIVTQCLMRVRQFEAQDNVQAALAEVDGALATYPGEPRLVEARASLKSRGRSWFRRPIVYVPSALLLIAAAAYFAIQTKPIQLAPAPATLAFGKYQIGSPAPEAQSIELKNAGIPFTVEADQPWIVVEPKQGGPTLRRVRVSIKTEELTPGDLHGSITIVPNTKATVAANPAIPVTITVEKPAEPVKTSPEPPVVTTARPVEEPIEIDPPPPFSYQKNDPAPNPQQVRVRRGRLVDCRSSAAWLLARMTKGACWLSIQPAGLASGPYSTKLVLKGANGSTQDDHKVVLEVKDAPVIVPQPDSHPQIQKPTCAVKRIQQYYGSFDGDLTWTGDLSPQGEVVLDCVGATVFSGGGELSGKKITRDGGRIPPVELKAIQLTSSTAGADVQPLDDRITIRNTTSTTTLHEVRVHWHVKQ